MRGFASQSGLDARSHGPGIDVGKFNAGTFDRKAWLSGRVCGRNDCSYFEHPPFSLDGAKPALARFGGSMFVRARRRPGGSLSPINLSRL